MFCFELQTIDCRVAELYEYAMLPEHMRSPDPTVGGNSITETGALCISSGSKAGRVPKQKRIVEDDITRDVSFLKRYLLSYSGLLRDKDFSENQNCDLSTSKKTALYDYFGVSWDKNYEGSLWGEVLELSIEH